LTLSGQRVLFELFIKKRTIRLTGSFERNGDRMNTQKAFLLAAIVLTMASVANAELTLTVKELDTSTPVEVNGKDNLVIAVAGPNKDESDETLVTAVIGKLEPLIEANTPAKRAISRQYLFNFTDESGLGIVNLNVDGELVYQIVYSVFKKKIRL
jgi:hypothetical protein